MTSATPSDPTFRKYNSQQAKLYAKVRPPYSEALCSFILEQHTTTGGAQTSLLDVGCGPGLATRALSGRFTNATGVDPSPQMVSVAKELGGVTASGEDVRYELASAEEIDKLEYVPEGSVDLVTAAMAAHWFDMERFWPAAARVLKPGGSVAIWAKVSLFCRELLVLFLLGGSRFQLRLITDPNTPQAKEVKAAMDDLELNVLAPFELDPNRGTRLMYEKLPLPWDIATPVPALSKANFKRFEWDRDGVLSDGVDFLGGSEEHSLYELGQALSTSSMVTRWREAHPDLAGTESDCVAQTMQAISRVLGAEAQSLQETKIRLGTATVLLMAKKS